MLVSAVRWPGMEWSRWMHPVCFRPDLLGGKRFRVKELGFRV